MDLGMNGGLGSGTYKISMEDLIFLASIKFKTLRYPELSF